jgi:hypothetical protein
MFRARIITAAHRILSVAAAVLAALVVRTRAIRSLRRMRKEATGTMSDLELFARAMVCICAKQTKTIAHTRTAKRIIRILFRLRPI